MNRIYRLVFNRALGVMQVASELANSCAAMGSRHLPNTLLAPLALAVAAAMAMPAQAQSLPGGGTVTSGSATISTGGNTTTIYQSSQRAAFNWDSFNIATGYTVNFTGGDIVTLNRVTGSTASTIAGTLTSTGTVFLLNPNGVVFGSGAQVNVGGLVVSTLSMDDDEFMSGSYIFSGTNSGAAVKVQAGANLVATSGPAVLLGNAVSNAGAITASQGSVNLVSGNAGSLTFNGDGTASMVFTSVSSATSTGYGADNTGTLTGRVVDIMAYMGAGTVGTVINNAGTIVANAYDGTPGSVSITGSGGDVVAGDIQAAGAVDLVSLNNGSLSLGTVSADSLTVISSDGAISQTGTATVSGTTMLSAAGDITMTQAGNDFGAGVSAGGGAVALYDVNNLILDTVFANSLTATAGGALTTGTITAAGNVTLQSAGALTLGASNIGGTLSAASSGDGIGQTGSLTVTGATLLSAPGAITLTNLGNDFGSTVTADTDGALTLSDVNGLSLGAVTASSLTATAGGALSTGTTTTTGNASLQSNGALSLGDSSIGGSLTAVSNAGAITQSGALQVNGTSTLTAAGNITLANAGNDFGGAVSVDGNAISLFDANNLTVGSLSSGSNANVSLTAGGALALPAQSINTGTGALTLASLGGSLSFGGALSGGNIALTGRDGITLSYDVSASGTLSMDTTNAAIVQTAGTIAAAGATALNAGTGAITLAQAGNDFGGAVSATGGAVSLNDSNALILGTVTASSLSATTGGALTTGTTTITGDATLQSAGALSLGSSDIGGDLVATSTGGAIAQSGAVSVTGTSTLTAAGDIALAQAGNDFGGAVSASGNAVTLADANDLTLAPISASSLTLNAGDTISAGAIDVGTFTLQGGNWVQNAATLPTFSATDFRLSGGTFLRALGGDGTTANPWQITDVYGLQGIGTLLSGNFALANDIDASGTANWNSGAGFDPIGDSIINTFTGTFDGLSHVVSGLTINHPNENNVGLFGYASSGSSISNIGLESVSVTGGNNVGALVGRNSGSISNAYATGIVTGSNNVGGLVGYSEGGSISNAYATGIVAGSSYVGGLVGQNSGSISSVYATGSVSGTGDYFVGGLVGSNNGSISNAYATGSVSGSRYVGGLAGSNGYGSSISNAYATGSVTGSSYVGGLVGVNDNGNSGITSSYWATDSSGQTSGVGIGPSTGATGVTLAELMSQTVLGALNSGTLGATFANADGHSTPYFTLATFGLDTVAYIDSDLPTTITDTTALNLYTMVRDVDELQAINENLGGYYALANDIDASATSTWNDAGTDTTTLEGFDPIGNLGNTFTGTFDGLNHVVSGLTINRPGEDYVGLFGFTGNGSNIANTGLEGGSVTGSNYVGGLVGWNGGSITNAYATGIVKGTSSVGGLVGLNLGSISNAYATGNVTGGNFVGGLVGQNASSSNSVRISNAYASGSVSGSNYVGGLVGVNIAGSDSITNTFYATTDASGNAINNGGVVDSNWGGNNYGSAKTHADLTQLSTFSAWGTDIDAQGGTGSVWRIYEGNTTPLLRSFLTALTVTADSGGSKTYDATTSATGSYTPSDPAATLLGTASYVLDSKNAGQRTINVDGLYSDQQGYDITFVGGSYTVGKAELDVTGISAADKTYDGTTAATLGGIASVSALGSDVVSLSGTGIGNFADENAGTDKAVTVSGYTLGGTDAGNYNLIQPTGLTADIDKAGLVITASDVSKTYGDTATLTGYAVSGLVSGDTVSDIDLASTGSTATANVGNYTITAANADGAGLSNYDITYVDGVLSVGKAGLTITASDANKTYGDTATLTGYSTSGLVNGDTVSTVDLASTGSAATANVGDYTITAANADGTGLSNYDITYVDGVLSIGKAGLVITASDANKTYGDTATLTDYSTSGLVNGDTVSTVDLASSGSTATANVGDYTITAANADGTGLSNYDITYVDGVLSVGKAGLTITASNGSKTYGETATLSDYTVSGLVNGDAVSDVDLASAGSVATANVGDYTIAANNADGTGLSNYDITYVDGVLSVSKAGLTITAGNGSKTYGETAVLSDYTVSGLVNGDAVSDVDLASAGSAATANVGGYTITAANADGTGLSNYDITYVDGVLSIGKAGLTITAGNGSKTYGETTTLSDYTVSGLVNGDAVSDVDLASSGSTATANVGNYTITAANADGTGLSNYDITYVDGVLSVGKAGLTITASDANKTYGDTATLTGYSTSGLVNGDTVSTVDLASTGSAATANVGDYTITATNADGTGLSNYDITYVDGVLSIGKAGLTITAGNGSKTYGETTTLSDYTVSGLVNGDAVSDVDLASSGSTATANVGNYTITAANADGTGLSNYDITYVDGVLSVGKAGLTITASNGSKTYGETATLSDYTVSGLVNNDTVSDVDLASSGSTATANVGNYTITAANADGAGLSNYDITYVDGVLSVGKAGLTITASNGSKTYGETATLSDYTVSGLVNGDAVSDVDLASAGTAATANVGGYTITAANADGAGLSNYDITYVDGVLSVGKAGLTITARNGSKTYGETATLSDYTVSGLVNGDAVSDVDLASAGSTATANVGNYTITAANADGTGLSNYDIAYVDGVLSVGKAGLTITASNGSKTYGETATLSDYTVSGLVNGDAVSDVDLASAGTAATANVGGYTITAANADGTGLSNYDITYVDGVLSVSKAGLTITAGNGSKTYGETAVLSDYTVSGLVNGDAVSDVDLASAGSTATANVGNYTITAANADGTGLSNYDITYVDGVLNVGKAGLTITAGNGGKTYGENGGLNGYTVSGLVNGDAVSEVDLASTGSAATANVGDYTIAANNADGTGLSNYDITYVDGVLSVSKAGLTITAGNGSKTYGETAVLSDYTVSGLVNGDAVSDVDLASAGSAATANVGGYTITAANADGTGLSNYDITYVDGVLSVGKAGLVITANDANKTYGDTATLTDYSTSGLVNGDTVSTVDLASTGSTATANVGDYTITAANADGTGLSNYDISYVDGSLSIGKAALVIAPADAHKLVGQSIDLHDYTVSGLRNQDSVEGIAISSSGSAEDARPGNYLIVASDAYGDGLSNYDITYEDGNLGVFGWGDGVGNIVRSAEQPQSGSTQVAAASPSDAIRIDAGGVRIDVETCALFSQEDQGANCIRNSQ